MALPPAPPDLEQKIALFTAEALSQGMDPTAVNAMAGLARSRYAYNPEADPTLQRELYLRNAGQKSLGNYLGTDQSGSASANFLPNQGDVPLPVNPPTQPSMNLSQPSPSASSASLPPTPPESPSLATNIGNAVVGLGKALVSPVIRFGEGISTAVNTYATQGERDKANQMAMSQIDQLHRLAKQAQDQGKPEQAKQYLKLAKSMISGDIAESQKLINDLEKAKENVVKGAVGTGAFFIPGGGSAVTRVGSSILSGGMFGFGASKKGEEIPSTLGGAVIGGTVAGALEIAPKVAQKVGEFFGHLGHKSEDAGRALIQSQYNLPRSTAETVDLPTTVQKLNEYGYNNIDDVLKVAPKVTGSSGTITKMTREAVANAQPVSTTGYIDVVKEIASDPALKVGQDKKFTDFAIKGLEKMNGGAQGNIGAGANPLNVFDFIHVLEDRAAGVTRGRLPNMVSAEDQALANAYRMLADELKDRLFVQAGADQALVNIAAKPAYVKALQDVSPKLANDVAKATTVRELRSLAAPFVRGQIAAEVTKTGQNLATNTMAGAAQGLGKFIQNPLNIAAIPLSSNAVNATAGKVLTSVPQGAANLGANLGQAVASPLTQRFITSKLIDATSGGGIPEISQQNPQANNANYSQPNEQVTSNNVDNQFNQLPSSPSSQSISQGVKTATGYTQEQLSRAIAKATMAGDKEAVSALNNLYQIESNYQKQYAKPKLTGQMAIQYTAAQTGIALADSAFKAFIQTSPEDFAPYARLTGLSKAALGTAGFNNQASTYNSFINGIKVPLAKALGNVGQLNAQEQKDALNNLPSLTDSKEEAAIKVFRLKSIFQTRMADIEAVQSGAGINALPAIPIDLGGQ